MYRSPRLLHTIETSVGFSKRTLSIPQQDPVCLLTRILLITLHAVHVELNHLDLVRLFHSRGRECHAG